MTKRPIFIIGVIIAVLIVGAVAWWLASPLFISNAVDEAFPFDAPSAADIAAMSEEEKMALEANFAAAVPDETAVAQLSAEDQAAVEAKVQEAAAIVMTDKNMAEPMPETAVASTAVKHGSFVNADDFHQGSGTATIYQQGDDQVLRLEAFNVTNGPDLHVVLSPHPAPASSSEVGDYLDLGSLKGNEGNQNYPIPANVNLADYQSVVIYCVPFHVVFSTATLN